ncbi:MAG: MmcQ/YjbR family DNA-binding protein [Candidatus Saccharimonadales bacterium]
MDHKTVEDYILQFAGARLDYPFGEGVAVYKVDDPTTGSRQAKMFALIAEGKQPLNLSLKCDPNLSQTLREKYETVMPGYHLNKKHWNTIILSGQLSWPEIQDLINHSYNLVSGQNQSNQNL